MLRWNEHWRDMKPERQVLSQLSFVQSTGRMHRLTSSKFYPLTRNPLQNGFLVMMRFWILLKVFKKSSKNFLHPIRLKRVNRNSKTKSMKQLYPVMNRLLASLQTMLVLTSVKAMLSLNSSVMNRHWLLMSKLFASLQTMLVLTSVKAMPYRISSNTWMR